MRYNNDKQESGGMQIQLMLCEWRHGQEQLRTSQTLSPSMANPAISTGVPAKVGWFSYHLTKQKPWLGLYWHDEFFSS